VAVVEGAVEVAEGVEEEAVWRRFQRRRRRPEEDGRRRARDQSC
jgi:hypothetical protein